MELYVPKKRLWSKARISEYFNKFLFLFWGDVGDSVEYLQSKNGVVDNKKSRWIDGLIIFGLLLLTLGYYWKLFFQDGFTLMGNFDQAALWYPWFQYNWHALLEGTLPLWDPYQFSGHSFVGEGQTGALYPLNILMLWIGSLIYGGGILPLKYLDGYQALHNFLGATFAYLLGRSLRLKPHSSIIIALVFAFGGFNRLALGGQFSAVAGAIWLPLILFFVVKAHERSSVAYAMAGGFALGMSFLVGHAEPGYFNTEVVLLFSLALVFIDFRQKSYQTIAKQLVFTIVVLAVGIAFASIQILPLMENSGLSRRWFGGPGETWAGLGKIPYEFLGYEVQFNDLIALINPALAQPLLYIGIFPMLLAVLGLFIGKSKWRIPLLLLIIIQLFILFGHNSILHGWQYLLEFGSDKARFMLRRIYIPQLAIALLSGFGVQEITGELDAIRFDFLKRFSHFLNMITFFFILFCVYLQISNVPTAQYFWFAGILLVLSALVIALRTTDNIKGKFLGAMIIALIILDLFSVKPIPLSRSEDFNAVSIYSPDKWYAETKTINFLKSQSGQYRIDNYNNNTFPPNFGQVHQLRSLWGHQSTIYLQYLDSRSPWFAPSTFYNLLNVRYIARNTEKDPIDDGNFNLPVIFEDGPIKVYENPDTLGPAWVVPNVLTTTDKQSAQAKVQEINLKTTAVIPQEPYLHDPLGSFFSDGYDNYILPEDLPLSSNASLFDIKPVVQYKGFNEIEIEVEAPSRSLLVLSEVYFPGWKATLNGKPREIYPANGFLRGIFLDPGLNQIQLYFAPRSFYIGFFLSSVVTILSIVLFTTYKSYKNLQLTKVNSKVKTVGQFQE